MRAKRIDANQNLIVKQLRKCGFSVFITSAVGKGFPDIVVGSKNKNFLFELKDSNKTESRKKLTNDEKDFFKNWAGQVDKVETFDQILSVINGAGRN